MNHTSGRALWPGLTVASVLEGVWAYLGSNTPLELKVREESFETLRGVDRTRLKDADISVVVNVKADS